MREINFTREDLELKDDESLMLISLNGKQLAVRVTEKDIKEWGDCNPYDFAERYMVPCLRKLAEELTA